MCPFECHRKYHLEPSLLPPAELTSFCIPGNIAAEAVKCLFNAACTAHSNKTNCRLLANRATDILNVAAEASDLLVQEGHWELFMTRLSNKLMELQSFVKSFSSHGEPQQAL
jgi:hypothetical protein